MTTPPSAGGQDVARRYYLDVVAPLLATRLPGLPHAAGRLGSGSDVLGLDDEMSRDHDWGLRLSLLVDDADVARVDALLATELPDRVQGLPTRFATTRDPTVRHRVEVGTPDGLTTARLGVDLRGDLDAIDWLALTGQSVVEVTGGPVFADTHGRLTEIRRWLAWYPDDVWLYVLAADWARLAQELPFVGRTGMLGDDAGSRSLAGRLVRIAMHLGFLLDRRWPPYPKWTGTAFATLPVAGAVAANLRTALATADWRVRQEALGEALTSLHDHQRALGLPAAGSPIEPFYDRPFVGVREAVAATLLGAVTDPLVRRLPPGVGSVEQWVDGVDVLVHPARRRAAARAVLGADVAAHAKPLRAG